MSLTLPSLGKQTVVEEALLKKMAQLHNKRRQLKEKKAAEEKAKLAEQRKPGNSNWPNDVKTNQNSELDI